MGVAVKPPNPVAAPLIEWKAGRIEDSVARLRFLQTAAAITSRPMFNTAPLKRWRWRSAVPVVLWACMFVPAPGPSTVRAKTAVPAPGRPNSEDKPASAVWLVEDKAGFEIYSNGLRVDKEFTTGNRPRTRFVMLRPPRPGADPEESEGRSIPAGIVFHSTESLQAPFLPSETRTLKRIGRNLLEYVRQIRAYHYLVDRFGRVYRVVREPDSAHHAGRSIWGGEDGSFIQLNSSFLGVAIEGQSEAGGAMNSAQIHAARVLTDMLRAKYGIPVRNCVTHAQVSVNPDNFRIGYHTDWAAGFPFSEVGLPDNYRLPLASMTHFGFEYDDSFLEAAHGRAWPGLIASLEKVRDQASAARMPVADYRRHLQQRFRKILNGAATREREEGEQE